MRRAKIRGVTPFDLFRLAAQAQLVIALRLAKIARGGRAAKTETIRMVSEKVKAAAKAQRAAATLVATGRAKKAAARTLSIYGSAVRANVRRLTK